MRPGRVLRWLLRNLLAGQGVEVRIGRLRFAPEAGFGYDGSDGARRRLVQLLPLVALRPRDRVDTSRYDTAT